MTGLAYTCSELARVLGVDKMAHLRTFEMIGCPQVPLDLAIPKPRKLVSFAAKRNPAWLERSTRLTSLEVSDPVFPLPHVAQLSRLRITDPEDFADISLLTDCVNVTDCRFEGCERLNLSLLSMLFPKLEQLQFQQEWKFIQPKIPARDRHDWRSPDVRRDLFIILADVFARNLWM